MMPFSGRIATSKHDQSRDRVLPALFGTEIENVAVTYQTRTS